MDLGTSEVNCYLEIVQNEMVSIVERTNVDMVMQAVRLNLELPFDVRLNSNMESEID